MKSNISKFMQKLMSENQIYDIDIKTLDTALKVLTKLVSIKRGEKQWTPNK